MNQNKNQQGGDQKQRSGKDGGQGPSSDARDQADGNRSDVSDTDNRENVREEGGTGKSTGGEKHAPIGERHSRSSSGIGERGSRGTKS